MSEQHESATEPAPVRVKVRRTQGVRFLPWLVTGAVLGLAAGLVLAMTGPEHQRYTVNTQTAYVAVMGALLGAMLLGLVAALLDSVLSR